MRGEAPDVIPSEALTTHHPLTEATQTRCANTFTPTPISQKACLTMDNPYHIFILFLAFIIQYMGSFHQSCTDLLFGSRNCDQADSKCMHSTTAAIRSGNQGGPHRWLRQYAHPGPKEIGVDVECGHNFEGRDRFLNAQLPANKIKPLQRMPGDNLR